MADPWEELAAKYGGGSQEQPAQVDQWAALAEKYAPPKQPEIEAKPKQPQKQARDATTLDRAAALASGFNYGAIPGLAGMPVDTIQNIIDLGKAGVGTIAGAVGRPDLMPNVSNDRRDIAGSSQWIADKIRGLGGSAFINNPAPQDQVSRNLYAGGAAVGSTLAARRILPASTPPLPAQAAKEIAAASGGALASGAIANQVYDSTGDPALAALASFSPTMLQQAGASAARGVMRGGDAGRERMAQNIADAERAGTTLTVGQASQQAIPQVIEALTAKLPGGYGVFRNKGLSQQAEIGNSVGSIAQGTRNEPINAGNVIQGGIQGDNGFRGRYLGKANELFDAVGNKITNPVEVNSALARLASIRQGIPGAAKTSEWLGSQSLTGLEKALAGDSAATSHMQAPGMPYQAVKGVRTAIGEKAFDNALIGNADSGKLKSVYGALSEDMKSAANQAGAGADFNRANRYWEAGMKRTDMLQPLVNKATPEQAFETLLASAKHGPSVINSVKRSLTPGEWKEVVNTAIDGLAKSKPGQQNAQGTMTSSETFLTNWNTLDSKAKSALISGFPGAEQARAKLDAIANTSSNIRSSSKVLANPSGTGPVINATNLGLGSLIGSLANPWSALIAPAVISGTYGTGRLMTNPDFTKWLSQGTLLSDPQVAANAMRTRGLLEMLNQPENQ